MKRPMIRVLLVEDDRDTRKLYALALSDCGFDVEEAHNGNQAFEKAVETAPDIIVTDLAIPGIDGFELSKRLRGDPRTSRIPVIALTGRYMEPADAERARAAGLHDVLIKPVLPERLASELARVANSIARDPS